MARFIVTKHYDNGKATAQLTTEKVETGKFEKCDVYCDELEDNASARDWLGENCIWDGSDALDVLGEHMEDGKTVNISNYI